MKSVHRTVDNCPGSPRKAGMTSAINFSLFALHVGLAIIVAFVMPLMFAENQPQYLWMILFVAMLSNQFWALIHEAIHAIFYPKRSVNNLAGRIMGICFGSAFGLVKAAHLVHHKVNRTEIERPEISLSDSTKKDNVIFYYYLFMGLYINEIVAPFLSLLPRKTIDAALSRFFTARSYNSEVAMQIINKSLNQVRIDTVIILLVWGISFYLYGSHWYILALFFLTRGFMISFLDYVYHYNTPVNDVKHGYNLELPKFLQSYLLNFNLHGMHHLYPQESWEKLPELLAENGGGYDKKYFPQALNQLHGTIKL